MVCKNEKGKKLQENLWEIIANLYQRKDEISKMDEKT